MIEVFVKVCKSLYTVGYELGSFLRGILAGRN